MRIAIDYTAGVQQRAGIGRFTRELVHALLGAGSGHDFVLLQPRGRPRVPDALPPGAAVRTLPVNARMATILWHRLRLPVPAEVFTGACDIFHAPDYALPPLRRSKGIVTVHDLGFVRNPAWYVPALTRYLSRAVPDAVRRADLVLADSVATKQDLVAWLGIAPERVAVVYGGVAPHFQPRRDAAAVRQIRERYGLPGPYLLSVSTLEPRKNLVRLLEAYAQLRARRSPVPDLAIAGGRGWLFEEIDRRTEELALGGAVRFLSYVPDADLPALLSLAEALVFPSLYEGFGLPPLEAMACGTPVVASTAPCLPEVLGDAALLVDPLDVEGLANALGRVLEDRSLRAALIARGHERAQAFRWDRAARDVLAVYERLGANRTPSPAPEPFQSHGAPGESVRGEPVEP
ncbi:MAG: glycosyltransferase family 4 protein [Chloroflexi bacterium]|nr:glycosyltransferase family 4 protein [Chloroflexota bacterium]